MSPLPEPTVRRTATKPVASQGVNRRFWRFCRVGRFVGASARDPRQRCRDTAWVPRHMLVRPSPSHDRTGPSGTVGQGDSVASVAPAGVVSAPVKGPSQPHGFIVALRPAKHVYGSLLWKTPEWPHGFRGSSTASRR